MEKRRILVNVVFLLIALCNSGVVFAADIGTAFTYQGHLYDNDDVANDLYDFQFKLYNDPNIFNGAQLGSTVNVPDVDVTDGYFTAQLDFGSSPFDGEAVWLEIGVRPGDIQDPNAYIALNPLQEITPAPYALHAKNASPDADWTVLGNLMYTDAAITDYVGIGTANPFERLDVNGNLRVNEGNILLRAEGYDPYIDLASDGAADSTTMRIKSLDAVGFTVTDAANDPKFVVNTAGNVGIGTTNPLAKLSVGADGVADTGVYCTGSSYGLYSSSADTAVWAQGGSYGVIGTGSGYGVHGTDSDTSAWGRLGYGGYGVYGKGTTHGVYGTTTNPSGYAGYFTGGQNYFQGNVGIGTTTPQNKLDVEGAIVIGASYSGTDTAPANGMIVEGNVSIGTRFPVANAKLTIDGAILRKSSTMYGTNADTHINLGRSSTTGTNGQNNNSATVGGGWGNEAGDDYATVAGGYKNTATKDYATVAGGYENTANGLSNTVGGGWSNDVTGSYNTISGGTNNSISGSYASISGGSSNEAGGYHAFIGGGSDNAADGDSATVAGGSDNSAGGQYSFAAGRKAKVRDAAATGDTYGDEGTFVWADSTTADFISTGPDQFLIRATGGVGINTTTPGGHALAVNGTAAKLGGGSWAFYSDRRLKKNIQPLTGTLDRMMQLKGVNFEYDKPEHFSYVEGQHIGMIAQDIEKVFPDWISENAGYKTVTFYGFEALTVESLRELRQEKDAEIAELKNENKKIKKQLAQMQQILTQLAAQQKGGLQ